jgi:2'-5' RNA ligase
MKGSMEQDTDNDCFYRVDVIFQNEEVTDMEILRTFLALETDPHVIKHIMELISPIQDKLKGIRWVGPSNIHLTLKFFGDTTIDQRRQIIEELKPIAGRQRIMNLEAARMGCFPNVRNPRIVWIGLTGDVEPLEGLYREVEDGMARLGWEQEERPFTPHLTIGRQRKDHREKDMPYYIEKLENESFGKWTVDRMVLFKSLLTREGAIYTPIEILPFGQQ